MDYSVRTGERADLVATLRQFEADRAQRAETERATEARRAAQLLEDGGDAAYFERVIYSVGDPDRWSVISGPRDHIVAQLRNAAAGWRHQDKPGLGLQAEHGAAHVQGGADMARVGHLLYVVRV
jgi:hypothetical protein